MEEEIDLWELFQCWLWGEKLELHDDDNDHVTDAKHAAGNSFKAHKRKLTSADEAMPETTEYERDESSSGFMGSVWKKLVEILQDDGKARKHSSRGRQAS